MAEADPRSIFNVRDAEAHFEALVDRAHAGEEIVVLKDGEPWARLVPIGPAESKRRVPGRFQGMLGDIPDSVWFDPLPDGELDAWDGRYSGIA